MKQTNKHKPRKNEHGYTVDLVIREGNTPLVKLKDQDFKSFNEVLEMLERKLP